MTTIVVGNPISPEKLAELDRLAKENDIKKKKWDTQAVKVIKEKINHYKKTGNTRKLAIYQAKLKQKQGILAVLPR